MKKQMQNPISEFLSDETFKMLSDLKLLNLYGLRDYIIHREYNNELWKLKQEDMTKEERNKNKSSLLETLRKKYNLKKETIRKIVLKNYEG